MLYALAAKGETLELMRLEVDKTQKNVKIVIKIILFNLWSSFVTNLAYFCIQKMKDLTESQVIRLTVPEMEVILKMIKTSRRYEPSEIATFVMKWSKQKP